MPTDVTPSLAEPLRGLCGGAVHLPGDPGYDDARLPWNLQLDVRPAAVAYPAFPDEVAQVLRAAAGAGLRVVVMGTGHGSTHVDGRLSEAVLLRTSGLTGVAVDADGRSARVGAGARWGNLVEKAARAGLTGRHMSSPDVGVVGSTLGGGVSWFGRAHGLQSSALTAVEVVLADGTLVRADDRHDGDLLWAARGGGGGLGVVTAVEFDLLEVPMAYAGVLAWDIGDAERVLRRWAAWAPSAPERVTTALRLMRVPAMPGTPEQVRGRHVVVLDGAVLGDPDDAARVLAPLREVTPLLDAFSVVPAGSLASLHQDPEGPLPGYATSSLLAELPDAAVDAVLRLAGPGTSTALQIVELRQLGGALARPAPRPAALDRLDGEFLVLGIGTDPDPATWEQQRLDADALLAAVSPWQSGRYLPMVDDRSVVPGWDAGVAARLDAARRAADPAGLFALPTR